MVELRLCNGITNVSSPALSDPERYDMIPRHAGRFIEMASAIIQNQLQEVRCLMTHNPFICENKPFKCTRYCELQ